MTLPSNRFANPIPSINPIALASIDAGGRLRTSQPTTLGDYKQIGFDRTLLFSDEGNGTGAWADNKYALSVAGTQYQVKQSRRVHPYFSGKSQLVEITADRMQHETGVTKRWGYFSSAITGEFSTTLDGFFLESDGADYYIKAHRAGTETISVPSQQWDNWAQLSNYNWQFFTVIMFDFLWLGGALLRMWVKTDRGWILAHTCNWSGSSEDVFILNPSQPLRTEIRSTNAGGQTRFICGQVATEGQINESGQGFSINTGVAEINLASADTLYPLIAVRKKAARLEAADLIDGVNIDVGSANDRAMWELHWNPTLSAGLTYADVADFSIQKAPGDGTITVSAAGTLLASGPIRSGVNIPPEAFKRNFLPLLSQELDGTMDEFVLCVNTQTSGINATGYMDMKEF